MRWPVERLRAIVVLVGLGTMATGCGYHPGSSMVQTASDAPDSGAGRARCVSAAALDVRAGDGARRVVVRVGGMVTLQLVEPEAYGSTVSGPAQSAFPWLPGQSSDTAGLQPVAVCTDPPVIMSLPFRMYPFRAIAPGRYQITAALNPAYHVPQMRPSLPRLNPVRVTVVVHPWRKARSSSISRRYTVTASVLYRTGMGTPKACLTYLLSLPPAGCGGVSVAGYDFEHLPGVVRYGAMGWQTSELRMVGVWSGHVLRLTRPPVRVTRPAGEPAQPVVCAQSLRGATGLARRITRAHARLNLLELAPCGRRVWVLVAVADAPTRAFIRRQFGEGVVVTGWLRRAGKPKGAS